MWMREGTQYAVAVYLYCLSDLQASSQSAYVPIHEIGVTYAHIAQHEQGIGSYGRVRGSWHRLRVFIWVTLESVVRSKNDMKIGSNIDSA